MQNRRVFAIAGLAGISLVGMTTVVTFRQASAAPPVRAVVVTADSPDNIMAQSTRASVFCPAGMVATGGGGIGRTGTTTPLLRESAPIKATGGLASTGDTPVGWQATDFIDLQVSFQSGNPLTVYAVCTPA